MSGSIRYEAWLILLSLVTGAWLMLVYDLLRVFRLVLRHGPLWTGLEDFFYWLYAGFMTFGLLYEQNDGAFRAYVVAGVFAGMLLYDRLVSRIFFRCLKKAGKCFRMVTGKLEGRSILRPGSRKGDG